MDDTLDRPQENRKLDRSKFKSMFQIGERSIPTCSAPCPDNRAQQCPGGGPGEPDRPAFDFSLEPSGGHTGNL
jgi:hypothetical protein